ncbi:fungal Zn, 2-cys(6) binuclear cluster domain protein [Rhizoctonia solani 123E]|uniref:Fungal Zn, 2-cys(6) binuclear cluster domain protein n=1 Tax=Rhizoctonia solani 123E TaxID=1423351 RepID=A0A074SFE5_9AGAM|nr:fungal Zn, 2-cys(6) binuclear cluster domain protein [Rhizoctonia solani 123E]
MDPYRSQPGGSRGTACVFVHRLLLLIHPPPCIGYSSSSASASASSPNSTSSGSSNACTYCHERKRRCVYEGHNTPCRRCRRAKRPCVPRQRAPRARPQSEAL